MAAAMGNDNGANHKLISDFGRLFGVMAGQPHRIDEHRSRLHQRRNRIARWASESTTLRRRQSRSSLRDEREHSYCILPRDFMVMVAFIAASRFRRGATSDFPNADGTRSSAFRSLRKSSQNSMEV